MMIFLRLFTKPVRANPLTGLLLCLPLWLPIDSMATEVSIANLPDPTVPFNNGLRADKDIRTGLKLQSILLSGLRKSAIINGYIKTVGSHINGGKIISISHNTVVISRNGKQYTLHLKTTKSVTQRGAQP